MIHAVAVLLFLCCFHFLYEMIVAPSLRLNLGFRLFALRDQLRRLKMTAADELDDRHFHGLQDSLNALVRTLDVFDLSLLVRLRNLAKQDAAFRARVEARASVLDGSDMPEFLEIRKRSIRIALEALAVNSGGWIVYLIPVLFAVSFYSRVKILVRAFASISGPDLCRIERGTAAGRVACS
jgi:hypothetical protein